MYGKLTSEYFDLVMNETQKIMQLEDSKDQRELGEAILNEIFQTDGPRVTSSKPSRKEKFLANKIFRPMGEIIKTIEAIENIGTYLRSFPYKKQGISPLSYLQYHVENYMNEIYILKTRLIAYLDILKKSYGKSDQANEVLNKITPLYSVVSDALKPYSVVRGAHVHELRYSDQELSRLATLDLLSRSDDELGRFMKRIYLGGYRTTRKKWAEKIQKDSVAIKKLLDFYFGQLKKAIFQDNQLIVPKNYR
jgi:hypothetical protein